jgi:hypothetical protein
MKTRQEHNLEICQKLMEFFSNPECKDLRFFQGLAVLDILDYTTETGFVIDPFNKESKTTNDTIDKFFNK